MIAMPHPTTRVLTILDLLQSHGRMTGAELARRLKVDGRTVRRYIVMLEELGIPIATERGRDGAYMLVAGFKLPPMMFTDDEAMALSMGLVAAKGLGIGQTATAVTSAQAKLERVMPANLKKRVRAIDETVILDIARTRESCDPRILSSLSSASQTHTRVHLKYRADRGDSQRDFDCYGLVYRGGHWYAAGMCHLRKGVRTFRLDRVVGIGTLTVQFEKPPEFNAADYLVRSVAAIPRTHTIEVLLRTTLAEAQQVLFPAAGLLESVDGGVLLHAQADDLDWFARELSRLSVRFEIAKPAALRKTVSRLARDLLRNAAVR
jgi:predicted DNA-binding transcriptional regulator YafY